MKTNRFTYIGDIVAKPRMTQADKWKHRPVVDRYFAMKDEMLRQVKKQKFELGNDVNIVFYLPMPESWSERKKNIHNDKYHKTKPDIDNLIKSVFDCMKKNDQTVYGVSSIKLYSNDSMIIITNLD